MVSADVRLRVRHGQVVRIARAHLLHQIDLLDGHLHGRRPLDFHRNEHRPELRADVPCAQPRNVRHQRRAARWRRQRRRRLAEVDLRQITAEALADLPRQVVVSVDERCLREDPLDALCVAGRGKQRRGEKQTA
jgi:uncharacterized protein YjiS (DUF1127 family)